MSDEREDPDALTVELRRLRDAWRKLEALDAGDPKLPRKLERLKDSVRAAIGRVDFIRGRQAAHLSKIREEAYETRRRTVTERHRRLLAAIDELEREAGVKLTSYKLAELLNARDDVRPFRGLTWNASSIRFALKAAGRV